MIAQHIDFAQLATLADAFIKRSDARKGGSPAYPTEVMVRVLVPASDQRLGREDRQKLNEGESPDWSKAKRRQKDVDATHTKKHGKSYFWLQAQCERWQQAQLHSWSSHRHGQ